MNMLNRTIGKKVAVISRDICSIGMVGNDCATLARAGPRADDSTVTSMMHMIVNRRIHSLNLEAFALIFESSLNPFESPLGISAATTVYQTIDGRLLSVPNRQTTSFHLYWAAVLGCPATSFVNSAQTINAHSACLCAQA
jgi:hypothetical protein